MKQVTFADKSTGEEISIAYSDYGKGRPIVLIHGWPLSKEIWEYQVEALINAGLRVIKYDRRGFGKSSKPWSGYDYDTLASDLNEIMVQLDLQDAILVGFSMGGGEVVRYISKYGQSRINRIVLVSSIIPYMQQSSNNPDGVDPSVFEKMLMDIKEDRIGFLEEFGKKFFGVGFLNNPVSTPLLNYYQALASKATQRSTLECAKSFAGTDFRKELETIKVPVLIIHGEEDKTVPIAVSSDRTAKMIPDAEYIVYEGAPHGLFYTHKEELNTDLIRFAKGRPLPKNEDAEVMAEWGKVILNKEATI